MHDSHDQKCILTVHAKGRNLEIDLRAMHLCFQIEYAGTLSE